MARPKKLWWNAGKQAWFGTVEGKKRNFGEDKVEAERIWHALLAGERAGRVGTDNELATIFNLYLEHLHEEKKACYPTRRRFLQSFKDCYPTLKVSKITVGHVHRWLKKHPGWNSSSQWTAVTSLNAAINWGGKPEQGYLRDNPIRGMKKPRMKSRGVEAVLSKADQKLLLEEADPTLRDALTALWNTGMRPGMLVRIELRHCDFPHGVLIIGEHKTVDKTGRAALVPMTAALMDLCRRLGLEHPTGPLFRGPTGRPWTVGYLGFCLIELRDKLGDRLRGKPILYSARHSIATELLEAGVPESHVAAILGHTTTAMLSHHYSHLSSRIGTLAAHLEGVTQQPKSPEPPEDGTGPS